jgi:glucose/arabinose dehydrogenase
VLLVAACSVSAGSGSSAAPSASTSVAAADASAADGLVDIGAGLHGPAGLTASVYATGLANASAFAEDASGGLWVATAAFTDEGDDAVYLVGSDGAEPLKVIDGLHTPLGLLWVGDSLFVSSAGGVDAYGGFDGSAFATRTTILALDDDAGESNGLAMSPGGRIVLGISAPCDACAPTTTLSAAVVSFLPDGGDVRVDAMNIRAPIGLAYLPGTGDLFVTMNQRDDLGEVTPGDWLALVSVGDDWGFPACYGQVDPACAGVPAPVAVLDTHAAVSGLAFLGDPLTGGGAEAAVVAEWAGGVVKRVALSSAGSTYSGTVSTYLTGFGSPVALLTAADGSLFVGDWASGTVYRIAAG